MIVRTTALCLRHTPFSETSRVVSWFTPHHGRIATMIKGSQRPKSMFLGQYDVFATCELLYYDRPQSELHIARECSPMKPRYALRTRWKACAAASYLCDLTARSCPDGAAHADVFSLLDRSLDLLTEQKTTPALLRWYELQLLRHLGLSPRLHTCMRCGVTLSASSKSVYFHAPSGGISCAACAEHLPDDKRVIAPDVLAILQSWQQADTPAPALRTHCSAQQAAGLEEALGAFLIWHLDTPLKSRTIAAEILAA